MILGLPAAHLGARTILFQPQGAHLISPPARTRARIASPPSRRRRHRLILAIVAVAALALSLASAASAASTAYLASDNFLTGEAVLLPINLSTGTPGTAIPLTAETANGVVVSPDDKAVYGLGNNRAYTKGYIVPVDTETNLPGTPIEAESLLEPKGAAVTPDGKTMYVAVGGAGVVPVDLETGTVGATIGLPDSGGYGAVGGVAFSPDGSTAYVASFGKVYIVDVATGTPVAEPTSPINNVLFYSARHIAVSPDGGSVWVATGESNWLVPIDTATETSLDRVTVPSFATNLAFTGNGSKLWALSTGSTTFLVPIDPATHTAGTGISFAGSGMSVESFGNGLAVSPNGKTAYVSSAENFVAVNLQAGTVGTPVHLPVYSVGMAVATIANPAGASNPTITTVEPTQSGVVGDPTNPTMTINLGQLDENGEPVPPEDLTVTATTENGPASAASSPHLPASNVTITGTGSERVVHFDPVFAGLSNVTLTVEGEGGKTASISFYYASSMETTPTSRVLEGGSDESPRSTPAKATCWSPTTSSRSSNSSRRNAPGWHCAATTSATPTPKRSTSRPRPRPATRSTGSARTATPRRDAPTSAAST
jgi:DNA-binding beta-propeller fold protein YncE